jgi:hypothetical protein
MKGYKDYMNTRTVDPILHDKIMQYVTQKPKPLFQRRLMIRYAMTAACAAVFLFGLWAVPGFINSLHTNDLNLIGRLDDPQNGGNNGYVAVDPEPAQNGNDTQEQVRPPLILHALVFNTDFTEIHGSRILTANFSYALTAEQYAAIFPGLDEVFDATVTYSLERDMTQYWREPLTEIFSLIPSNAKIETTEVGAFDADRRLQILVGKGPVGSIYISWNAEPQISTVHGVEVTATIRNRTAVIDDEVVDAYHIQVDFMLDEIVYQVSYTNVCQEAAQLRITEIVNQIIVGGAADWSVLLDPIIPPLREERMPLNTARLDPDFGAFMPVNVPTGFQADIARRTLNQSMNSLSAIWHVAPPGFDSFNWTVREPLESDLIVSVNDREKFDVSLYAIPWADSVPNEIRAYFQFPVFLAEEMSVDIIQARTRWESADRGDTPGWRTTQFGVLYGDVIIVISARGLSPEQIWGMLP